MADGSVTFDTRLDNSKLEKDLDKTAKRIDGLNQKIAQKEVARAPIVKALKDAKNEAVEAYNNIERLQKSLAASQTATASGNLGPDAYMNELENQKQIKEELKEQEKILKQKEATAQRLADKDAKAVQAIEQQTVALEREKESAGQLQTRLEKAQKTAPLNNALAGVESRIDKLGKRIMGLARRVFVFTLITAALRGVRSYMGHVINSSDEASAAMARLKAALLTLAQPLMDVVIPAFTAFVNVLTRIAAAVAWLLSALFGKTIDQSKEAAENLYNEASGIKAVGSEAKKSAKFLAAFDEINQVPEQSGSGGGKDPATTVPDFGFDTSTMEADFGKLLKWIELIGSGLLAWKLGNGFLDSLRIFAGLILAINGAIELAKGTWDAWQNGVNWGNMKQMLTGLLEMVTGLWIVFGKMGAGIGLIAGGVMLFATALHDAYENGWNLKNLLLAIAGIMAGGIGIGVLTGHFIPALIAGITSVLLALTVATGHGEELIQGVHDVCQGFLDFITGIFAGDIEKALAGVGQMFRGLHDSVFAVINGVQDTILSFLTWLDEKTGGQFHSIIESMKNQVVTFFADVKKFSTDIIENLKLIFSGLVEFIAGVFTNDWDRAWNGVKNIFRGVLNGITALFEGMINAAIGGFNNLSNALKKFTAFKLPDWMGGYEFKGFNFPTISKVSLPRLAAGAVIPPNREFMAVLGDQKSGNNIEAPEDLIRKIVREESGGGNTELLQAILEAIRDGHIIMVDGSVFGRTAIKSINDANKRAGKQLLLI